MSAFRLLLAAAISYAAEASSAEAVQSNPDHQESIAGVRLWVFFCALVLVALVADDFCSKHYAACDKAIKGAIVSSIGWVALGFVFAFILACLNGFSVGFTFLTGYLVEKSLSVDNLVVIALIFKSFRIKPHDQGPVLKWGSLGAVVFRLIFIFAGVWLLEHMHSMIYVFGAVLLWSAWKMYNDDEEEEVDNTKHDSWMMQALTFFIPYRPDIRSNNFIEYLNGQAVATPMLAALVVVELSDLIFAVDSIPCILGLTHDLFVVFSSNVLAVQGLRALYVLLAEALDQVKNLKTGLAVVLAFVGGKMMVGDYVPIPQWLSLLVIFGILGVTVATSMKDGGMPKSVHMKSAMLLPM